MSFQLSASVVNALLDRLGNDDGFRDRFCADPRDALASLGFAPAADPSVTQGVWACMEVQQLASKEAIRAGRDQLTKQLVARALFTPFHLEARPNSKAA